MERGESETPSSRVRPQFVLVHGAGHGAWCWYKIRSLLETSGHEITCLDLKGSGIDPSDPNTIFTLEDYDQPLANFLSNLPQNQKVHIHIYIYIYIYTSCPLAVAMSQ
jgi:pimeloyl-ACP methyl ester carboxylesterase